MAREPFEPLAHDPLPNEHSAHDPLVRETPTRERLAYEDGSHRHGIDSVKEESPAAGIFGIAIPALVIIAAAAAYFIPGSDRHYSQAQATPPATSQPAPVVNPDQPRVAPQSQAKEPPADRPQPEETREPRTDSQNSN